MRSINISIIIPVKKINNFVVDTLSRITQYNWKSYEVIIVTNIKERYTWPNTNLISSGNISPADKRNLGAKHAKGSILAFLDDDSYPAKNWLKIALNIFKKNSIAAVGGPAITPLDNSLLQKIIGAVFESYMGSGPSRIRCLPLGKKKEIYDWPSVNLLVRKKIFDEVRGYNNNCWSGEDTKLCLDIINKKNKIVYNPKVIVYHHRRKSINEHIIQISRYGFQRGSFARHYPKTSFKLVYFLPTLFVIFVVSIPFIFVINNKIISLIYLIIISLYLFGLIIDSIITSIRWKNYSIGFASSVLIFLTHIFYGINFIKGFISKKILSHYDQI